MAKDPCQGCVCFTCKGSAVNGNLYGCKLQRCSKCDVQRAKLKLMSCGKGSQLDEKEEFSL